MFLQIKDIAEIYTGYSFRKTLKSDPEGSIPIIQMSNVDSLEGVMEDELIMIDAFNPRKDHYFLKSGDIIMNSKGYNLHAYLIPESIEGAVPINSFLIIRLKNKKEILPEYLAMQLNSLRMQHKIKVISAGTNIPSLSIRTLNDLAVPVFTKSKQRILAKIDELKRKKIKLHHRLSEKTERMIDTILQQKTDEWSGNNNYTEK